MKNYEYWANKLGVTALMLGILSGCAIEPNWRHSTLSDPVVAQKQLKQDQNYCTLVAAGSAPMPQIAASNSSTPQTANINVRGSTFNTSTGTWTNSTYTGQITTQPSGGFAGGLASGLSSGAALGAAIAAQRQQEAVLKACMELKGWVDVPKDEMVRPTNQSTVPTKNDIYKIIQNIEVYPTPNAAWKGDIEEFLWIYPGYTTPQNHSRLDTTVRQIAKATESLNGRQILWKAHEQLQSQALVISPPKDAAKELAAVMYKDAANGDPKAALSMAIVLNDQFIKSTVNPNLEFGRRRLLFWLQRAALSGDPNAIAILGERLWNGDQVKENKADGYKLIKYAANIDTELKQILKKYPQFD